MSIDKLTKLSNKVCSQIPEFINTTSFLDHAIWNNMMIVNDVILKLISNKIYTNKKIDSIIEEFDKEVSILVDITDDMDKINKYYTMLITYILYHSIEFEVFETATNIRNFESKYKLKYQF